MADITRLNEDLVSASDNSLRAVTSDRNENDSLTLSGVGSRTLESSRSENETVSSSDGSLRSTSSSRSENETSSVGDDSFRNANASRTTLDITSSSDGSLRSTSSSRSAHENPSVGDVASRVVFSSRRINENLSTASNGSRQTVSKRFFSETVTITDLSNCQIWTRRNDDSVSTSDGRRRQTVTKRIKGENVTAVDGHLMRITLEGTLRKSWFLEPLQCVRWEWIDPEDMFEINLSDLAQGTGNFQTRFSVVNLSNRDLAKVQLVQTFTDPVSLVETETIVREEQIERGIRLNDSIAENLFPGVFDYCLRITNLGTERKILVTIKVTGFCFKSTSVAGTIPYETIMSKNNL